MQPTNKTFENPIDHKLKQEISIYEELAREIETLSKESSIETGEKQKIVNLNNQIQNSIKNIIVLKDQLNIRYKKIVDFIHQNHTSKSKSQSKGIFNKIIQKLKPEMEISLDDETLLIFRIIGDKNSPFSYRERIFKKILGITDEDAFEKFLELIKSYENETESIKNELVLLENIKFNYLEIKESLKKWALQKELENKKNLDYLKNLNFEQNRRNKLYLDELWNLKMQNFLKKIEDLQQKHTGFLAKLYSIYSEQYKEYLLNKSNDVEIDENIFKQIPTENEFLEFLKEDTKKKKAIFEKNESIISKLEKEKTELYNENKAISQQFFAYKESIEKMKQEVSEQKQKINQEDENIALNSKLEIQDQQKETDRTKIPKQIPKKYIKNYLTKDKGKEFLKKIYHLKRNYSFYALGEYKAFTIHFDYDSEKFFLLVFLDEKNETIDYPETLNIQIIRDEHEILDFSEPFEFVEENNEKQRIGPFYLAVSEPFIFSTLEIVANYSLGIKPQKIYNMIKIEEYPCLFFSSDHYQFNRLREVFYHVNGYLITPDNIKIFQDSSKDDNLSKRIENFNVYCLNFKEKKIFSYQIDSCEIKEYNFTASVEYKWLFKDALSDFYPIIFFEDEMILNFSNYNEQTDIVQLVAYDEDMKINEDYFNDLNEYVKIKDPNNPRDKKPLMLSEVGNLRPGFLEIQHLRFFSENDKIILYKFRFRGFNQETRFYWLNEKKLKKYQFDSIVLFGTKMNLYKYSSLGQKQIDSKEALQNKIRHQNTFLNFRYPMIQVFHNNEDITLIENKQIDLNDFGQLKIKFYNPEYIRGKILLNLFKKNENQPFFKWKIDLIGEDEYEFVPDLEKIKKELRNSLYVWIFQIFSDFYNQIIPILEIKCNDLSDPYSLMESRSEIVYTYWKNG